MTLVHDTRRGGERADEPHGEQARRPHRRRWAIGGAALCANALATSLLSLGLSLFSATPARASTAPPPWPTRVVAAPGFLDTPLAVPGTNDVLGIVGVVGSDGVFGRVTRVDLLTGSTTLGSLVFASAELVRSGDTFAVIEPTAESVAAPSGPGYRALSSYETIRVVQPGSGRLEVGHFLRSLGKTTVPLLVSSLNPSAGIWVEADAKLALISPGSGAVVRSFPSPFRDATSLAPSPDGSELYVSGMPETPPGGEFTLDRLDARTGAVRARFHERFVASAAITAVTSHGVWIALRFGMSGGSSMLNPVTLAPTPTRVPDPAGSPPSANTDATGGSRVYAVGSTLWIETDSTIACSSPTSETLRASTYLPRANDGSYTDYIPLATVGHTMYAAASTDDGGDGEVLAVRPPDRCF